jgi:hypothetical protein
MKMVHVKITLLIMAVAMSGCTSLSQNIQYKAAANENSFDYFFPSYQFDRTFSTIEEAYDYVNTARIKFSSAVNKPSVKGLAAKLSGPASNSAEHVYLHCFLDAVNLQSEVDLSKIDKPLEAVLKEAISVNCVFLIFYEGRATSIPDYHLKDGYIYTKGNAQQKTYSVNGNSYDATYPVGWGIDKAFQYLKGEIN